jgi:hypothetical protein
MRRKDEFYVRKSRHPSAPAELSRKVAGNSLKSNAFTAFIPKEKATMKPFDTRWPPAMSIPNPFNHRAANHAPRSRNE